jgi:arabinosaccharide transport system permease protein
MASVARRRVLSYSVKYVLLGALVAFFLFPVVALILASFRPGRDLMRYGIAFKTLIPESLDPKNFAALATGRDGVYLTWFKNSIVLTVLQAGLSLILSSFVGYGLGVYSFKGRNLIFVVVLAVMLVPLQILILPLYKLMATLGIMNSYLGVLAPFVVSPFAIFFFRQYSLGIPRDFLDAGRIDGLGEFRIFFLLTAPLMAPAFGAMAILMSQQAWNSFLWPLIVMRTGNMFPLTIGLNSLLTPYGNNYDMLIAGSCAASVPIIILFFFFQRFFISGLSAGGIKG